MSRNRKHGHPDRNPKPNAHMDPNAGPPPNTQRGMNQSPDWTRKCENCGETPVVPATGMCGPCTFGEAEAARGNW